MSNRLRRILRDHIAEKSHDRKIKQKRPWTYVHISIHMFGSTWSDFGFSKACYPDRWDPDRGVELAALKASNEIAKRMIKWAMGDDGKGIPISTSGQIHDRWADFVSGIPDELKSKWAKATGVPVEKISAEP
jgi:hypothetical protein